MNPLLLILSFLTLLGILTTSEMSRFVKESKDSALFRDYREGNEYNEELYTQALLHKIRIKTGEKPPEGPDAPKRPRGRRDPSAKKPSVSLQYNESCPPNNARLDWKPLFYEKQSSRAYALAAALMRSLYRDFPPFQEIPQAECRILDTLLEQSEKARSFHYAEELATLDFQDENVRTLFFWMLKGSGCPCLLDYITFDMHTLTSKKINFMFAPREIFEIFLDKPDTIAFLLKERAQLWERIDYEEKHRKQLPTDNSALTRTKIHHLIEGIFERTPGFTHPEKELKNIFNTRLGTPGNLLISTDPATDLTRRFRIQESQSETAAEED